MTTRRQADANRANAKASTGPRTVAGKRQVAQNARRHGLTAPPPWDQVARWYRVVTSDPQAQPVPHSIDPYERSALRLAEAEAHVARTTMAERDHLFDMQSRLAPAKDAASFLMRVIDRTVAQGFDVQDYDMLQLMAKNSEDPFTAGAARILASTSPTRPAALRRTMKTLTRYRRDAESARRRAFKAWLNIQNECFPETKPNYT
jgi:hypothetical protein